MSSIFAAWLEVSIPSYFRIAVCQTQCPRLFFPRLIFPYLTLRYERVWECISDTRDQRYSLGIFAAGVQTLWISNVLYNPTLKVSLHTIFSVNISQSWNRRLSRAQRRTGHWHLNHKNGVMGGQIKGDWKNYLTDDKPWERERQTINNVFSTLLHY